MSLTAQDKDDIRLIVREENKRLVEDFKPDDPTDADFVISEPDAFGGVTIAYADRQREALTNAGHADIAATIPERFTWDGLKTNSTLVAQQIEWNSSLIRPYAALGFSNKWQLDPFDWFDGEILPSFIVPSEQQTVPGMVCLYDHDPSKTLGHDEGLQAIVNIIARDVNNRLRWKQADVSGFDFSPAKPLD